MRKRDAERLLKHLIQGLDEKYDLIYISQGDQLNDKQVSALLSDDFEALWEGLDEWESEATYHGVKYVVEDITTSEERAGLEQHDLLTELEDAIREKESGSWFKDLVNATPGVLMRVNLVDEDDSWFMYDLSVEEFLTRVGMEPTEKNLKEAANTIANASPEFSLCLVYALATVEPSDLNDLDSEVKYVEIIDPHLWLGNPFTGSGYAGEFEGRVLVKRADLRTDKEAFGYSWNEVVGGGYQTDSSLVPADPNFILYAEGETYGIFATEDDAQAEAERLQLKSHFTEPTLRPVNDGNEI